VYDRAQPYGKKPGFYALLVTQTVSGVWHGLYAGYWLFFVHSAFMFQGSRFLFKLVSAAPECASPSAPPRTTFAACRQPARGNRSPWPRPHVVMWREDVCGRVAEEGRWGGCAALQPVLRLAHGLLSSFQLNYLAVAFLALEWGPTMNVWRSINFAGHFVMAAIILTRWGGGLWAAASSLLSVSFA
jgi:hypothetical protein